MSKVYRKIRRTEWRATRVEKVESDYLNLILFEQLGGRRMEGVERESKESGESGGSKESMAHRKKKGAERVESRACRERRRRD